jgi:hypothetical protein
MRPSVAGSNRRERIQRQLEKLGITEDAWCKQELGCDIGTMRRRVQLAGGRSNAQEFLAPSRT